MSKSRTSGIHDIGFFRNIGIALVTLAVTAGSITLSLTLRSNETSAPSNIIADLTPLAAEEPQ
jgi:hypothetical protein